MKCIRYVASTFSIGIALAQPAPGQTAQPEGGLGEIVVTAQKRSENIQTVPITISAITAEALKERAISSFSGISNLAPNVTNA